MKHLAQCPRNLLLPKISVYAKIVNLILLRSHFSPLKNIFFGMIMLINSIRFSPIGAKDPNLAMEVEYGID